MLDNIFLKIKFSEYDHCIIVLLENYVRMSVAVSQMTQKQYVGR